MKYPIKLITAALTFIFSVNSGFAIQTGKIQKLVSGSDLNKTSTVAVSVKKIDGGIVFEQNQTKLLHPASALKIFSLYEVLDRLGYEYMFKTSFYKDARNNLYIKTGADPLLTSAQLKEAFQTIKSSGNTTFNNLYIDDSIIDKKEFAQGWMWDDDINEYAPKVSAYNIDGNVINVSLKRNSDGTVSAFANTGYKTAIISNITASDKGDLLDIQRYNWLNPEVVEISGFLKTSKQMKIPVSNMRRYYIYVTQEAIKSSGITIKGTSYSSKRVPENAELITSVMNGISGVIPGILKQSNNLYAQTLFKIAASEKYSATGTDYLASEMFKDFYKKINSATDSIVIKDGCGISRNNLVTVDWMSEVLAKIYKNKNFDKFIDNMAQPGDGTLGSRLYELRGNAWLKTGSLSNVSAIAGYVRSKDGHVYAVAILTQNFNVPQKDVKDFEDEIINYIYDK